MSGKEKREPDQIKLQSACENIPCATCVFRDRFVMNINGKKVPIGMKRAKCEKYQDKPNGILFYGDSCEYYVRDNNP